MCDTLPNQEVIIIGASRGRYSLQAGWIGLGCTGVTDSCAQNPVKVYLPPGGRVLLTQLVHDISSSQIQKVINTTLQSLCFGRENVFSMQQRK